MYFKDGLKVFGTRISKNRMRDQVGQLICKNVVLSRTGKQTYGKSEVGLDGDGTVELERLPIDVFDKASIASFEGKPFTHTHPNTDVNLKNFKDLSKGIVVNVRPEYEEMVGLEKKYFDDNGNNVLVGDIIVFDEKTAKMIEDNEINQLSNGYNAQIVKVNDNLYKQTKIRGNHIALVENGRAGIARIKDSLFNDIEPKNGESKEDFISRFMSNDKMKSEYSNEKQRLAVAYSMFKDDLKILAKGIKDIMFEDFLLKDNSKLKKAKVEAQNALKKFNKTSNNDRTFKNEQEYNNYKKIFKKDLEDFIKKMNVLFEIAGTNERITSDLFIMRPSIRQKIENLLNKKIVDNMFNDENLKDNISKSDLNYFKELLKKESDSKRKDAIKKIIKYYEPLLKDKVFNVTYKDVCHEVTGVNSLDEAINAVLCSVNDEKIKDLNKNGDLAIKDIMKEIDKIKLYYEADKDTELLKQLKRVQKALNPVIRIVELSIQEDK